MTRWKRISTKHPLSNTLWYLCYICKLKSQMDIFHDAAFAGFCQSLDAKMKRLKATGLGVNTKQSVPVTFSTEEPVEQKLLGGHSPQALVDTLVYLCGTYFALQSVQEHRNS